MRNGSPSENEQTARLILAAAHGVHLRRYERLMERFGTAQEALRASEKQLMETQGVSPALAERLSLRFKMRLEDASFAEKRWDALRQASARALLPDDPLYPEPLRDIPDAPALLIALGNAPFPQKAVALVGQRRPTDRGRQAARIAASAARKHGWCVVSGLALGIDGESHRAALRFDAQAAETPRETATVAALPCCPLSIYPRQNRRLAQEIAENGLLVSENFAGDLQRWKFVQRNRIISGLSRGTLVIEAGEGEGSLHTARFANRQRRAVAVWDWSDDPTMSLGARALENAGAPAYNERTIDDWFARLEENDSFQKLALFENRFAPRYQLR